jgi:hypothetical protein
MFIDQTMNPRPALQRSAMFPAMVRDTAFRERIADGTFRGGHRPPVQREITTLPFESRRAPVGGAHL